MNFLHKRQLLNLQGHKVWLSMLLHYARSSNSSVVTGISNPNKSQAKHLKIETCLEVETS